jgi:hypothetical protein
MGPAYGKNTAQIEVVLDRLRSLPPKGWKALETAHARSKMVDAVEEALAKVLTTTGLRPHGSSCGPPSRRSLRRPRPITPR